MFSEKLRKCAKIVNKLQSMFLYPQLFFEKKNLEHDICTISNYKSQIHTFTLNYPIYIGSQSATQLINNIFEVFTNDINGFFHNSKSY